MFDWNDEELANIKWGEADDHIVPYPEGNEDTPPGLFGDHIGLFGDHIRKEWSQESRNAKPTEKNKPVTRNEYTGGKQESTPQHDTAEGSSVAGYSVDSWPDLQSSCTAKSDQNSVGSEVSKKLTVITKFDSSGGDETSQPEDGSKIFWDQHEDREQPDFVDYGWDNIGSFDDLDRIFSNDDAIFGHASLGNADRLWSSSKEATSAVEKSFRLSTNSPRFGLGTLRSQSGCTEVKTEYVQEKDQSFHHGFGGISYQITHAQQNVDQSADQVDYAGGQTGPAAKEKTELEIMHGNSLAFNSHLAGENITRPNDCRDKAFLAIQKQQQQFRHRVTTNDYSVAQKCLRKNQIQLMHGGNTDTEENVSTLLPIDPISPIEQDDSNTIPLAVDDYYSMEGSILHQLQDAIAKLDIRIRLCIRDSLSRLAKSAMRRHYASDTSSTNKNSWDEVEVLTKEETSSQNRVTPISDVETQTNPIDRAVAHLLFHRPFESLGKHPETPESPASTMLPLQCSPRGFVPDNYRSKQKVPYHDLHSVAEGDPSRNPCIDTSENVSNNEESDAVGMEIDASQ